MGHFDANLLKDVLAPVERARGLPNALYVDPAAFEEEKKRVFFENWAGIGFAKDIAEPGEALPIDFLGNPLLAVRGADGTVRVFQNTCRHRGMILIQEKTKLHRVIRCPYHSWCYGLDGALKITPHVGGSGCDKHAEIKPDELGLFEIRSHVFRDVIFVNISGDAPAFEDYAAELIERWREFDQPLYHAGPDSSFSLEVAANWKLAVENYCESYHLPFVHPGLNSYSKLEDHYHIEVPGKFSGQGTLVYNPSLDEGGRSFPNFKNLDAKWDKAAEYVSFFPNVLFGVHRDHAYAILLEPVSQTRTVEHVEIYYASQEAAYGDLADLRARNAQLWKGIFIEDLDVVEGMQRGRHGTKFDGGKFSPVMDGPTHCFHHWVASQFL
jgi:phenylpropionate dioxygenase-like ring-hydroxylating dioxygenase large terminal subunit